MKNRELAMLYAIIQSDDITMADLLNRFHISKRTFYYDIRSINYEIKKCGQIQNIAKKVSFCGDFTMLQKLINLNKTIDFFNPVIRRDYLLMTLLEVRFEHIDEFYERLGFSENTRINDLNNIKQYLDENGYCLQTKPSYTIVGDEISIRNLYLKLLQDFDQKKEVSRSVTDFNRNCDLQLTDNALSHLSSLLNFVEIRLSMGLTVSSREFLLKAAGFPYYGALAELLGTENKAELNYVASYISSLSSLKMDVRNDFVESYLNMLIDKFETKTAIALENREEFKENIRHHMISLYNRVLFQFSVQTNADAIALNMQHESLYKLVKSIVQECGNKFSEFQDLSENEICYLTAYFGGYLANRKIEDLRRKRVLLVCPHGLTVSKILQFELTKYIPAIEIVDTVAISQQAENQDYYDAIICTTELPGQDNVIVVNPILTKDDIQKIMHELYGISSNHFDVQSLMQIIEKSAIITNPQKLKSDLTALFYQKKYSENTNIPALKDLITQKKINIVEHVDNWEEGIELAARPLVEDRTIETSYIAAMIDSVKNFGPYIVLDDYFALPHAKTNIGVNRLGMSLLVVKDEVDILGHPVNVFLVLASVDTISHLNALGTLSDILCERTSIETFRAGNIQEILDLINRY